MRYKCPTCKKYFKVTDEQRPYFPFCSERCKLIDLGEWLDGEYRIITPLSEDKTDKKANRDKQ